jgi:hypothetical protein
MAVTASMLRKAQLICGILASLLYAGTDILAGILWEGYSFTDQAVSELSAIGAPTRPLVVPLYVAHDMLMIAFGSGVWRYSHKRAQRIVGGLLVLYAVIGLVGLPFPIHQRGAEATFTDTMHSALAGVTVLIILLAMAFGAYVYGKWFRFYSIGTLLILLVLGAALGFMGGAQVAEMEIIMPPRWFGLIERVDIYGFLLWVAVLAFVQLRVGDELTLNGGSDAQRDTSYFRTRYARELIS